MKLPPCHELLLRLEGGVLFVTLNRPECRNAMNLKMVDELAAVFEAIAGEPSMRAVVLRGAGGSFCSGGDVKDMARARSNGGEDPFYRMNRRFGEMITLVDQAPLAVITVLEGAVLGAGFGLACSSDLALAARKTCFGLPETGLGIPPAQIAPFVVKRIGLTQARRLAVLGARFDGEEAKRLGVVHSVFDTEQQLEEELGTALARVKRNAPGAVAVTKKLMHAVGTRPLEALLDEAAREFSRCLRGPEGREGTTAFKEKRPPSWAVD